MLQLGGTGDSNDHNKVGWHVAVQAGSGPVPHSVAVATNKGFSTGRMLLPVCMGLVISTQHRGPVPGGAFMALQATHPQLKS